MRRLCGLKVSVAKEHRKLARDQNGTRSQPDDGNYRVIDNDDKYVTACSYAAITRNQVHRRLVNGWILESVKNKKQIKSDATHS